MKHYDVIIIGSGPSGIITGVTAKKQHPSKSFLMLMEEKKGLVPCGIPYIFHDIGSVDKNVMGPKPFLDIGGEALVDKVEKIDIKSKTVKTAQGNAFTYDKLVLATGSLPIVPSFIPGCDLENVEYIKKSFSYMEGLKKKADNAKDIVVIGGGFIGVEVAEQLAKHEEKKVTLVEMENHCLLRAFSPDVAEKVDESIRETRVNLLTGKKVKEITGSNNRVTTVVLEDGLQIKADLVIMSIGYKPNTDLAKASGIELNKTGAIIVDRYLRTNVDDVTAVGDCAQTLGFITGRTDNIMLASTATAEARVLGYNLFEINLLNDFAGTLSVFSTEVNGRVFASAGAIEQSAKQANVSFVTGMFTDVDRHPGAFSDTSSLMAKLIVSPCDGSIIGGELWGGKTVGELINVVGLAIQKCVTVYELVSFQIGTHPKLTTAPTKYVLIKAAENALSKMKK
jgi:NADH oxidase (H2O2-forming)